MAKKKPTARIREKDAMDRLKWKTARELGLDDDLANPGDELTVREAGKIGGNMVKKLVQAGEEAIEKEER
ncbi:MAG: alpha/beta-type small acid-soluble spore protein [Bacillota bacterium]